MYKAMSFNFNVVAFAFPTNRDFSFKITKASYKILSRAFDVKFPFKR